jgi:hypothetical protein
MGNLFDSFTMIVAPSQPPSLRNADSRASTPSVPPSIRTLPTPQFTLDATPGETGPQVVLTFTTTPDRGVWIESRRDCGTWEFVTITQERTHRDWHPTRHPRQIEVREYRARYFDRATPGGPWSAVHKIVVIP